MFLTYVHRHKMSLTYIHIHKIFLTYVYTHKMFLTYIYTHKMSLMYVSILQMSLTFICEVSKLVPVLTSEMADPVFMKTKAVFTILPLLVRAPRRKGVWGMGKEECWVWRGQQTPGVSGP